MRISFNSGILKLILSSMEFETDLRTQHRNGSQLNKNLKTVIISILKTVQF